MATIIQFPNRLDVEGQWLSQLIAAFEIPDIVAIARHAESPAIRQRATGWLREALGVQVIE